MAAIRGKVIGLLLFLVFGPGGVAFYLYGGFPWAAFFWSLPTVAVLLAVLSPGRGPGHFAMTYPIGPAQNPGETSKHFQFRLAKWWLAGAGASVLVIGLLLALPIPESVAAGLSGAIGLFGVACLLKLVGSLFRAFR